MNATEFWQMIETAHTQSSGNHEEQMGAIGSALEELEPAQMLEFHDFFSKFHSLSYRANLWGAAYLMNGGCSDDGFDYFRGWLIGQGRKVFEAALENPDSLADNIPEDAEMEDFENEDILYVAGRAWEAKTGLESSDFYEQTKSYRYDQNELGDLELWSTAKGDADKEKCVAIYPKLWAKFGW